MTSAVSGGSVGRVEGWIGARHRAKAVGLEGQARGNQNDRSWAGALERSGDGYSGWGTK